MSQLVAQWESCHSVQDSRFIELLYQLAKDAGYYRKDSLALKTARQAVALAQKNRSAARHEDVPKALFRLGKVHLLLSDFSTATSYLTQTVDLSLQHHRWHWAAMAASELAFIQFNKGDHESSLNWTNRGMAWATKADDSEGLINNQYERVRVLLTMGQTADALALAKSIVARSGSIPSLYLDQPIYHRMVGNLLTMTRRFAEAEPYFLQSLARTRQLHNEEKIASVELDLGFYYYDLGRYDQALHYYELALMKAKDFNRQARLYDNIGAVYWMKKDFATAITYYQKGLKTLRTDLKNTSKPTLNPSARSIQTSAYKEYLLTLIQDKADTWLDWAKETGNPTARLQNALNTYALADSMIAFMRWEHVGQQSKLFWRYKTHRLYEQAIETSFRLNDAASAFRFFEKSRAVLLNDKLNELGANRQLSAAQTVEERLLRQRVADWQNKLAGKPINTAGYAKTLDSLYRAQEEQTRFIHQLERSNPDYYRYKYDNEVVSLAQVQQQLAQRNASLMTYFVGETTLYALSITATATKLHRLPAALYAQLASELLALNATPDEQNRQYDHYLRLSNQLYQQLLAPLALPPGRVIVSPDGVLLPFDALSASASHPDFLINQYAFSYAYSLNRLFREPSSATGLFPAPSKAFLGMAPVQFSARLNQVALTGSDASLQRISNRFSSPILLMGTAATRNAFRRQADQYQVIQLFTHAEADSSGGSEPALFFADSTLRLSELTASGQLPAELIGLSACKTGVGANQRGEGVFSLARGFALLGVPSVLTTLWNVESIATYTLTERFYDHLAEGLPKDLALRQAKLDYLAQADLTEQLPSRWAGLLLVGNADPLPKSSKVWVWAIGLGGLGIVSLRWWILRSKKKRNIAV
ncbi:hypothetical protein GCM10027347_23450 [Larkinella harenae]